MGEMTKELLKIAKKNNDPSYYTLKKRMEERKKEYSEAINKCKRIEDRL